ncbi:MAG: hypothetical protein R3219_09300 [Hydrogenovibrio sp.]|nr:hypothetical protein [Hydrogenovibrio sp.]
MFAFSVRYGLWLSLFFGLVFFEPFSPLYLLNQAQTTLTIEVSRLWVGWLQLPVQIQDNTLVLASGMNLKILDACNGLTPFLLYLAGVLAYPTTWGHKAIWAGIGYLAIWVINTLRLIMVTLAVLENPESFHLVHDWIGRYGTGLLTLGLFFLYLQFVPFRAKTGQDPT